MQTVSKLDSPPRVCPSCTLTTKPADEVKDDFLFDEKRQCWVRKLVLTKHIGNTSLWFCPRCTRIEAVGIRPDAESEMVELKKEQESKDGS